MTGPSAQIGIDALNVIQVALDIINNDVNVNLPLGKGAACRGWATPRSAS